MTSFIFDIETGPLPEAELRGMIPEFDPAEVKTGNIKDPDKITAKINEARASHYQNAVDAAALSPLTGRILAIGLMHREAGNCKIISNDQDEGALIRTFWDDVRGDDMRLCPLIGFNSNKFDLPFILKRGWKHGIQTPVGLRNGRYWGSHCIDLRELWQLGDYQAPGSLDAISKHLGLPGKTGSGKDFARIWAENREQARQYLFDDLDKTAKVANIIGVHV